MTIPARTLFSHIETQGSQMRTHYVVARDRQEAARILAERGVTVRRLQSINMQFTSQVIHTTSWQQFML